mmetsp:Transcript_6116/g.17517  ORF Transcript_6116/g.17517 Transcript_6116/m.17517 type:complete len:284 (+) Transcript_6116:359-1210(+)
MITRGNTGHGTPCKQGADCPLRAESSTRVGSGAVDGVEAGEQGGGVGAGAALHHHRGAVEHLFEQGQLLPQSPQLQADVRRRPVFSFGRGDGQHHGPLVLQHRDGRHVARGVAALQGDGQPGDGHQRLQHRQVLGCQPRHLLVLCRRRLLPVIAHNEGDHLDLLWGETQQVLAVADDVAGMLVVGRMTHKQSHTVKGDTGLQQKGVVGGEGCGGGGHVGALLQPLHHLPCQLRRVQCRRHPLLDVEALRHVEQAGPPYVWRHFIRGQQADEGVLKHALAQREG